MCGHNARALIRAQHFGDTKTTICGDITTSLLVVVWLLLRSTYPSRDDGIISGPLVGQCIRECCPGRTVGHRTIPRTFIRSLCLLPRCSGYVHTHPDHSTRPHLSPCSLAGIDNFLILFYTVAKYTPFIYTSYSFTTQVPPVTLCATRTSLHRDSASTPYVLRLALSKSKRRLPPQKDVEQSLQICFNFNKIFPCLQMRQKLCGSTISVDSAASHRLSSIYIAWIAQDRRLFQAIPRVSGDRGSCGEGIALYPAYHVRGRNPLSCSNARSSHQYCFDVVIMKYMTRVFLRHRKRYFDNCCFHAVRAQCHTTVRYHI